MQTMFTRSARSIVLQQPSIASMTSKIKSLDAVFVAHSWPSGAEPVH
ncbi:Hypothetical protein NGAL_HAMBI2427_32760 [Neorhizobium galegae bv. orientalis]|uniref:Uncharacterized protein n=1 Tax=Neorhizobium galegae bv. orientalis str. HAMBI 540 TaxID=1028800 RepID=A0A068T1M7_NEOGA|nr:Hypothetical protein RG540_PA06940 [Neorhizobium galegae bv. orientalis str. HAMBI 540]CDZ49660.1 Hypothetical protein NGAL_HAMBI2427_32760 [Neorhizobium galegae bv. orientalis]